MARMSANNTKISYKSGAAETFTVLDYLMEVPEFGGAPEKIDVTTLSDKVKKYVPGTKDLGDLVFKFLYDNSSDTSNYRVLKGQATMFPAMNWAATPTASPKPRQRVTA